MFAQNLKIIVNWVYFAQKVILLEMVHATHEKHFFALSTSQLKFFSKKLRKFSLYVLKQLEQLYFFQKKYSNMRL